MKHFFVIGNSSSTSLSPLIFNHWFKKYKIKAKYSFLEVKKQNFKAAISKKIQDKDVRGFNVTIPYKKTIIKILDEKSAHVKKIGAANCVTVEKKTKGANTDWVGYKNSIKGLKLNKNNNILILGFGGAAQAIVYSFLLQGHKNLFVFNRTKKLIKTMGLNRYTKKYSLFKKYIKKCDLLINTTPTNPLSKKQAKMVRGDTVVSDIVYKPKNTLFLKQYKINPKVYGIEMLIEQAAACFYIWFGFKPKTDKLLLKKIDKKIK